MSVYLTLTREFTEGAPLDVRWMCGGWRPGSPACPSAAPMGSSRLEPRASCPSSLRRSLVITLRDEFLGEEDLDLRTMTEAAGDVTQESEPV